MITDANMGGYSNNWYKKLLEVVKLILRNIVIIVPTGLASAHFIANPSELGNQITTIFSLYYGWLILEIINLLRTPVIRFDLRRSPLSWEKIIAQYTLEVSIAKDVFNHILGTSKLNRLRIVRATIGGVEFKAKWGSTPEPLNYQDLSLDPAKIPGSNITSISEGSSDYIIMLWVTVANKLLVADVWNYSNKPDGDDIPQVLPYMVVLEDDSNTYTLKWD